MNIIEQATDAAKTCLFPKLNVKIGDQFIGREAFLGLLPILKSNLQRLLDIFHANEYELLITDINTLEFRKYFILILCEQSSQDTIFQVDDCTIISTVENLCRLYTKKLIQNDETLLNNLFEYYRDTLSKDKWKYNIGAISGFLMFIYHLYNEPQENSIIEMDYDKVQFMLATGLNFVDHFEPEIKMIGLKLFNCMLYKKNTSIIREYNINHVILDEVKKLINKHKDNILINQEIWKCLFMCVKIEIQIKKSPPSTWNNFDTIFEALLHRLALNTDKGLSIIYLNYINKFCNIEEKDFIEDKYLDLDFLELDIKEQLFKYNNTSSCRQGEETINWSFFENVEVFRNEPATLSTLYIFRWIKKLSLLLQSQVFELGGDEMCVATTLTQLHVCYLQTLYGIPTLVIGKHFTEFIKKIVRGLIEVLQIYKTNRFISEIIVEFLKTISSQLCRTDTIGFNNANILPIVKKLSLQCEDPEVVKLNATLLMDLQECHKSITKILNDFVKA